MRVYIATPLQWTTHAYALSYFYNGPHARMYCYTSSMCHAHVRTVTTSTMDHTRIRIATPLQWATCMYIPSHLYNGPHARTHCNTSTMGHVHVHTVTPLQWTTHAYALSHFYNGPHARMYCYTSSMCHAHVRTVTTSTMDHTRIRIATPLQWATCMYIPSHLYNGPHARTHCHTSTMDHTRVCIATPLQCATRAYTLSPPLQWATLAYRTVTPLQWASRAYTLSRLFNGPHANTHCHISTKGIEPIFPNCLVYNYVKPKRRSEY